MLLAVILSVFSSMSFAQTNCDDLYRVRENGLSSAQAAFNCYQNNISAQSSDEALAHHLNQMSYLKFFIAEFHLEEKEAYLLDAISLAEKSVLLFGPKYSVTDYLKLGSAQKKVLAIALYNYGLATARYIDIKGQWEAIKRMEDIKRSMNTIIRIKEEAAVIYGAHRTLGIFHTKVPYIAGGRVELAKQYLKLALDNSSYQNELSLYPANNVAYADLMYKLEMNDESCRHLNLVAALTEDEVRSMDNDLFYETMQVVKDAKKLVIARKCSK